VPVEVVPEQGRVLAGRLPAGHPWSYREQLATSLMHRGAQASAEVVLAARADDGVVIADGSCVTPLIWHVCAARARPGYEVGPPEATETLLAAVMETSYDLVLLMAPDIPWVADGIRDDPDGRQEAFEEYRMLLPDAVVIDGQERLAMAEQVVSGLLRMRSDLP
jgi:nicotinamide riboside kinase